MDLDQSDWSIWAQKLHRWGLADLASFILQVGAPLSILAAQLIYMSQPFLRQTFTEKQFLSLAQIFENREQSQSFASYLREETQ